MHALGMLIEPRPHLPDLAHDEPCAREEECEAGETAEDDTSDLARGGIGPAPTGMAASVGKPAKAWVPTIGFSSFAGACVGEAERL
ncbi:MAG: hypothetical protein LQ352_006478 [Teloschistes flavicans]|nr:MAG: hypothetical protein LQ352_006478 [Teloschistes flavicans]